MTATRIGLGFAAACRAAFLASFLTACSPATTADGEVVVKMDAAPEAEAELKEALRIWMEESAEGGDAFSAGKAAYDIASATRDPRWAWEANRLLAEARETLPGFAQATAWQGSAQGLIARDYPIQGIWQVLPGPGYARIYHVRRAVALMNSAVEEAPRDPVVRLVRAATVSRMPGFLVDHGVAKRDFKILAEWEADPSLNPDHAEILTSDDWRESFLDAHETAKAEFGDS